MSEVIVLRGLKKSYAEKPVINDLSISVQAGEIYGLLGANGAGKTTTIECMLGVRKKDSGEVRILGLHPIKNRKQLYEQVGVQFQTEFFPEKIRVEEICALRASLYKNTRSWESLLSEFDLLSRRKQLVSDLSGGERQRLSVLLALIPDPKIVFFDELTTGLDAHARRGVWRYLLDLKSQGLKVFLTSHYMDEVQHLCDRICILKDGGIAIEGTVEDVLAKMGHQTLEEAYLEITGEGGGSKDD